jgi:alpha-beta hydrolase superfamily lysophospholipase
MDETELWLDRPDGTRIFIRQWTPERAVAAVQIVHGMAEHSRRYRRAAERLVQEGFVVWAADMRGHGQTAAAGKNDPARGGLSGHCADRGGFSLVVQDVAEISRALHRAYPQVPLFLMGHSWGSFIVQAYMETYCAGNSEDPAGVILSGTRGPGGMKIRLGAAVMALLATLMGRRRASRAARALSDGPFNRPFRPNRTPFDWLSRDEAEVNKYVSDPFCGMLCSVGFYRDMTEALNRIHRSEALERIPRNLPIYIFGGSADPVGDMGLGPTALVNAYRSLGVEDLEFVLYPDARHETLNETNREEVLENLVSWLTRHIASPYSGKAAPQAALLAESMLPTESALSVEAN